MRWFLMFLLLAVGGRVQAQKPPVPVIPVRSVTVSGGFSWPLTRHGLTQYWSPGPSGAVEFNVRIRRRYLLGVVVDVSAYWFRAGRFAQTNPGVTLENKPVAHITIALTGRYELLPERRIGPYFGLSVGASRLTEAVEQQVIDSVRVTYFNIPGRTRLSATGIIGVVVQMTRGFGLEAEGRLLYIHNDPDAGLIFGIRTGVRFSF